MPSLDTVGRLGRPPRARHRCRPAKSTFNSDFCRFVLQIMDRPYQLSESEEVFGTEIPDGDSENFGSPREMVDWLELHLSNQRPSKEAAALLRKLVKAENNPELAERLEGTWRREQVAAIVREIFRQ
jgi:hypothetical protein